MFSLLSFLYSASWWLLIKVWSLVFRKVKGHVKWTEVKVQCIVKRWSLKRLTTWLKFKPEYHSIFINQCNYPFLGNMHQQWGKLEWIMSYMITQLNITCVSCFICIRYDYCDVKTFCFSPGWDWSSLVHLSCHSSSSPKCKVVYTSWAT